MPSFSGALRPFFTFILSWLFLGEKAKKSYILIFIIALTGIVIAKPLQEGYMLGNMVALGVGCDLRGHGYLHAPRGQNRNRQ